MSELPPKRESDVNLPSISLPDDSQQISSDALSLGDIRLRPEDPPPATRNDQAAGDAPSGGDADEPNQYRVTEPPPTEPIPDVALAAAPSDSTFEPASRATDPGLKMDEFPADPPTVKQVWTRWTEWREPLLWTGAAVGLVLLIHFGGAYVTGLILFAGMAFGAYHFVITLEVPVRVTPEQAAKEYFAALGHRLPNFGRMYALLTDGAKRTDDFTGVADFRAYWNAQLARLNKFPAWLTPLEFRVESFQCRYNPEKTLALVQYKLIVAMRSTPGDNREPLAELDARNLAVKGPDGQWYLNDGRLPIPIAR